METCLVGCCSLLSAAVTPQDDSILANVKQLNEDQMQSVTGEDLYYYFYYPSTDTYETYSVVVSDTVHGYVVYNMEDFGESYDNIVEGYLDPGETVDLTPPGYH